MFLLNSRMTDLPSSFYYVCWYFILFIYFLLFVIFIEYLFLHFIIKILVCLIFTVYVVIYNCIDWSIIILERYNMVAVFRPTFCLLGIIDFNIRAYPLIFSTAWLLVLFSNFSVKPGNIYTRWYVASVNLFLGAV